MPPPNGDGGPSTRIWSQQVSLPPSVQQPSSSSIARSPSNSPRLAPFNPALPNSPRTRGSTSNHRPKSLSVSGLLSVPELAPPQQQVNPNSMYKVPTFASSSIDLRTSSVKERPLLAPFKAFQQSTPPLKQSNSYFDIDHNSTTVTLPPATTTTTTTTTATVSSPPALPTHGNIISRIQSTPSLTLDDEMRRGVIPNLRKTPGKSNLVHGKAQVETKPRITSSLTSQPQIPNILISSDTDSDATSNASSPRLQPVGINHVLSTVPEARRHSSFTGSSMNILSDTWMRDHSIGSTTTPIDQKGNVSMIQSVEELQKSLGGDVIVKLDAVEEILKARMTSFQQHLAGIRSLRNRSNELLSTFKSHAMKSRSEFDVYTEKYKHLDFSEFDDLEKRVIAARDKVDEYSQRLKIVNERIIIQEKENQTRQLRYKFIRRLLITICLFFTLLIILFRNLDLKNSIVSYYTFAFSKPDSPIPIVSATDSLADDFVTILESLENMDINPIITIKDKTYL